MTKWLRSRVSAATLCCLAAACTEQHAPTTEQQAPIPGLSGYDHTFANSRFHTGDVISEMDQFGMHKVVGSVGTFSTQLVSGAVVALPNVPFPDPAFGVFPGDVDAHNAAVRSYFVTAGLPEEQIAAVSANGTGLLSGQYMLQGWWSILNRGWNGVPIDDSTATAAFDAIGRASGEQIYWPEVPDEVLQQVRLFQNVLADPVQKAAYIQKLPASSRDPIVVIRHTSWFWKGPFQAEVCCRGSTLEGATHVGLCFDLGGHPVHLPDEESNQ